MGIGDEEMEEVDSFKYLGVWFDQRMRGNVQLEKMVEQAKEWAGKIEWMARVDGELEAERGRLLWDLVARPGLEHAACRGVVARGKDSRKEVGGCTG